MKIELPEKVSTIIKSLAEHGYEAYAVGGCVRDSILGRNPNDWDITTSAFPEKIKEIFPRTIDTGIKHGTVTVFMQKEGFEVTTYRIDGEYEDKRHPKEVLFTADLVEDLRRRDFTINAMAYNEEHGLVDVFGGQDDLENGVIRCVGAAKERFTEDALRVLRAIRFAAQLGFSIEQQTQQAMAELSKNLAYISKERIQMELVKLLISPHPDMLREAWRLGLTRQILPEFDAMMAVEQHNPHHIYTVGEHTLKALTCIKADKALRLAVLLHDVGKPNTESIDEEGISHFYNHALESEKLSRKILRRLKFDNATRDKVARLVRWHDYRFDLQDSNGKGKHVVQHVDLSEEAYVRRIRRAVCKIGDDLFPDLLLVMRADVLAQSSYLQKEKLDELTRIERMYEGIKEREECLSIKDLAVNGNDLMKLGIPQGKAVGKMLRRLLEEVLENPSLNDRETLLKKAGENINRRNREE